MCIRDSYWSYWHQKNGAWSYATSGATNAVVLPGAVEGWSWGGAPPKVVSLAEICVAPTATAAPPPPTAVPLPTNTAVVPTAVPVATSTAIPPTAPARPNNSQIVPSAT